MDKIPSQITSLVIISFALMARSFDATGILIQFASREPYNVVIKATAIFGPIELGSSSSFNMLIRPIRVPIIPQAGPMAARPSQKLMILLCGLSIQLRSVSRILVTSSWSVPSTISIIPFFRNSSSMSDAASSS